MEFAISGFHLGRHILALVLTITLCLSLVMSELSYHTISHTHHPARLVQLIVPYLLMMIFVSVIIITTVLTVRRVKTSKKGIEINTLFWQQKLAWADLQTFKSPIGLKFAWLKTKRVVYILAKNELINWLELERILNERFPIIKIDRR